MTSTIKLHRSSDLPPRINTIYAMMRDTREMLLRTVEDLTIEELDYTPHDRTVESIGTLLFHIAGVEWGWIFMDIQGQELEEEKWKYGFPLRKEIDIDQIKEKPLSFYLNQLTEIRSSVFAYLRSVDDDILDRIVEVDGEPHSIEWILYHVFEHELTHIGQIRLLKRLYKFQS